MQTYNIMIVGVGGQGTLLASRLAGAVAIEAGYDVKVSEVHGMSQRGGSVVTYVRYGEKVYSPLITEGGADIILSFELLEAARWLPYLKPGGKLIVNTQKMDPMPVVIGSAEYPAGLEEALGERCADVELTDALSLAVESGTAKAVNVVLIGAMARHLPFAKEAWQEAIRKIVPEKFREVNLVAFDKGYGA